MSTPISNLQHQKQQQDEPLLSAGPSTATSPTRHATRSSSYKGKNREQPTPAQMIPGPSRRPGLAREVGSATISLRQGAVELLGSDSDDEDHHRSEGVKKDSVNNEEVGGDESPKNRHSPRKPHHGRKTFKDLLTSHRRSGSVTRTAHSPSKLQDGHSRSPEKTKTTLTTTNANTLRSPAPTSQSIRFQLNRTSTLPSKQPDKSFQRRRARANSLHFPSDSPSSTDVNNKNHKDFYLSHYSTDRAYSLEPTKKQINLELGLGDDFDTSFGEAMRRGLGGEEMQLPPQALRVLSEAKENMDLRLVGKQGRKGSLGMGLFKESRERDVGEGKKRIKVKEQPIIVPEEVEEAIAPDSDPLSPTPFRAGAEPLEGRREQKDIILPPALPLPLNLPRRQDSDPEIDDLAQSTAGLDVTPISPTRASPTKSGHKSDVFSDESGWTTTDSDDDGSSSASIRSEGSEEMESTDEDEGESMTVPLQPFNHAVGGHSSIYKFTRRAVCKVSLVIVPDVSH